MIDGAERRTRFIHDAMCELETLQEQRAATWIKYEELTQDCEVLEQTIEMMKRRAHSDQEENLPATPAEATVGKISFHGCGNSVDRLVKIAEAWGGKVNCNEAADLLISDGISKSTRANLSSALQKLLIDRPEEWEYVGPKTYRYLLYRGAKVEGTNATSGVIKNNFE